MQPFDSNIVFLLSSESKRRSELESSDNRGTLPRAARRRLLTSDRGSTCQLTYIQNIAFGREPEIMALDGYWRTGFHLLFRIQNKNRVGKTTAFVKVRCCAPTWQSVKVLIS